jgi:hypothetical protein
MDVIVPSICLSSVAGAIFFYAGGRLRVPRIPVAEAPSLPSDELEAERVARGRAESEAAGAVRAQREAVTALADERGRSTALREELAGERDARRRADVEAASERRRLNEDAARLRARADAAETRAAALDAQLARARAELTKAQQEQEKAVAAARRLASEAANERRRLTEDAANERRRLTEEAAKLRARQEAELSQARVRKDEAEGLREENLRLSRAVAALESQRASAPDLAEVQRRTVSAAMQLRTLEQRAQEVTSREAENAELRRRVEALSGAAAEVEALRRRVRDLEALAFAQGTPGEAEERDEVPDSEGMRELDSSLALGLRELVKREEGCRTAVLSDTRGLLVAAYGAPGHRLELAAAAALTTTTAERLRELLPVGEPVSLSLVDDNAVELRTRWLRWAGECFLLSTIGSAPPADEAPAQALCDRLAELIGPA